MAAFDWDTLLDFITEDRSVVPVVGPELLGAPGGTGLEARIAARTFRFSSRPRPMACSPTLRDARPQ